MRCEVCNTNQPQQMYCPSCVNFQLLKTRLKYLDVLSSLDQLRDNVDSCIKHCIKGANYSFVENVMKGKHHTDNIDPSLENGVVALSSQLLTIDARILKRRNGKLSRDVESFKSKNKELKHRIHRLREMLQRRKHGVEPKNTGLEKEIRESTRFKQEDNLHLTKQINNSKSLLFQELINIYVIKRRRVTGTNQTVFMILFMPIISCASLVDYNHEMVYCSLAQVAKFVKQCSKVLMCLLPYDIDIGIDTRVQGNRINMDKPIWLLDNLQLRELIRAYAMLIVDVCTLLGELHLTDDIRSYRDLLRLDGLVYKLANNGFTLDELKTPGKPHAKAFKTDEPIDLEVVNTLCYETVLHRIRNKDNEWHVVKKEYLEK
ncbi:unnamed protein product [Cyberlindnera jadinii]|uniref:Autophagy-related protein 14 n=1 Tax=Cyberlindnera jadinii (strain ATCC 18201 / CBS 1600 / BCRC 20928 / JCM 3617 / NBRC 0987 / NRRL Y-1542) TaxID=983966 RepID=A0A0H5C855_CYBJN|nr:unnamed protein product [Cyberlindnera jadinii]